MVPVSIQYKVYLQLQYQWHQRVAVTDNFNTNDTNMWQSRPTTIPMTPKCGSHRQLQYHWHQYVAVTTNYNTDDTNKWQSQTTYKWTTSQSMINLCTIFTNWTNPGSRCTEPDEQYQSYHSSYQRMTGASNEAHESQLNQENRAVSLIHYWLLTWTPTT